MSANFDQLPERKKYGANRRGTLLDYYSKKNKVDKYVEKLSLEVDIEGYLKRKLGYSEWDKNWDVGLFRQSNKEYILLSRKNNLGSFEVIEKVELTNELKPVEWINICLNKHLLK